jgi:hypothetical protein
MFAGVRVAERMLRKETLELDYFINPFKHFHRIALLVFMKMCCRYEDVNSRLVLTVKGNPKHTFKVNK